MLDPRKITDSFAVSPQIEVEDMPAIAAAGYRSILCNRPDNEEIGQCASDAIKTAAEAAGLAYRAVPITSGQVSETDLADFRAALEELPAPVLAYCRTGTRCTMLWSIANIGEMPPAKIVEAAADAGYDMSGLVAQMTRS
ncbi:TIGR01244 family sulfur transferase [Roseovarius sp. ZX-A-9]|uniref:TIGR01244 family sulfur transferase n=1 Tax=Roseovarius sp. ZX-A-9 TaxID=3014783 RepID=UPI00232D93EA|nr:TIGR01244 family sulfur transferase [Roseovarius sp. ZX-A-9]MDX1785216.1 TIGR01244 family sulfur transferase [Roseovarius sp.]